MDIVMPQLGETVTEGEVTAWHKKPGDAVAANEVLFEVATDKVDTEIPAPVAGVLVEILVKAGETVGVGTRLGVLRVEGEDTPGAVESTAPAPQAVPRLGNGEAVAVAPRAEGEGAPLSPVVRRLIAEHGLDSAAISGSGRDGRITRRDALAHLGVRAEAVAEADETLIPFTRTRKLTAEHMVRSKATSPHVLQAVEADFHRVEAARAKVKESWRAREGFSLTYLPFVAHAVCRALGAFPIVNATVRGDALAVHRHVNLAIAVDLDFEGLVAPIIRNAETLSVAALARAINDLSTRARADRLIAGDFAGGTYTISNSGAFGTLITAPIINQPQVAILSTDGVTRKPVVIETEAGEAIGIRPIGVLAQSFDHRAFDGAYSAAFLKRLKELIETSDWTTQLA